MKKLILVLAAVIVLFAVVIGVTTLKRSEAKDEAPTETAAVTDVAADAETDASAETTEEADSADSTTAEAAQTLDFDAMYALHDPDEVVMTVNGKDVTWAEYFYWYFYSAYQIQNTFNMYSMYYGMTMNWEDQASDTMTYADVPAVEAESLLKQYQAILDLAEKNEIELSEENLAALEEQHQEDLKTAGENATEEEFEKTLKSIYMSRDLYEKMNKCSFLYTQIGEDLFGANGEKISDKEAEEWLAEEGYLSANHILFMTIDSSTNEALSDEEIAEKKAQAEKVAAELQAIKDDDERVARFLELKEELDEDTGKTTYPNGYVFTPGTMVTEFEDAVKNGKAYQVTDPVLSSYGYHVIMPLPVTVDTVLETDSDGTEVTAKMKMADEKLTEALQACYDESVVEYADGFTAPNLLDFLVPAES